MNAPISTPMVDFSNPSRRHAAACIRGIALIALFPFSALACSVSATGASFGTFDPLENVAVDTTGMVTVTCSPSASYTIELSAGHGGTYSPRKMTGPGGRTLDYNLFRDASRTTVWGDGVGGTSRVGGSDDGSGSSHTLYGRIPAGQNPYVGSYSDSIQVTVVF